MERIKLAMQRKPPNPSAAAAGYINLAVGLVDLGQQQQAVAALRSALEANPADGYTAQYHTGRIHKQLGQLDLAMQHLRLATEAAPAEAVAWVEIGTIHQERGNPAGAVAAYRRASRVQPGRGHAHYNCGNVLLQMGDSKQAAVEYSECNVLSCL